jgi:hypothetical protein
MKIYSKLVLDEAGHVLEEISKDYSGPVAQCSPNSPKPKFAPPGYSAAGEMVRGDLKDSLTGAVKESVINNPFLDASSREMQTTTDAIRGSYGARGLAGSGIAVQGENQAISDIMLKSQAARAGQLTGIMATGSSSPSYAGQQERPGKGFMGMK